VISKRKLVDTNLIVRYLVQDHERHAKAAGKLFDACDRGEVVILVLPTVLAECVFVLESFYEHPQCVKMNFHAADRNAGGRDESAKRGEMPMSWRG